MKLKNKLAILSAITFFQISGVGIAESVDDELALIAAEQKGAEDSVEVESFQPEKKTDVTTPKVENTSPAVEEVPKVENTPPVVEEVPKVENTPQPVEEKKIEVVQPSENISPEPSVGLPNPILNHASFNEVVETVNFIPLYIPKKSGYSVNSILSIDKKTAEIRYGRRWEPEVELHVRTHKRQPGEELKDISGVYGVKWRMDMTSGITIYIAKIDETSQVAAWAVGDYTFSAYAKNLSFAGFHALISEELVDLSTHYYIVTEKN